MAQSLRCYGLPAASTATSRRRSPIWCATTATTGSARSVGPHVVHSDLTLTDDERQLRDLANPLIQPSYDRHQRYQIIGEYGGFNSEFNHSFDRTAYATHLFGGRYRSPSTRYARLIDDIRNNTTRLPQFFETATRVLDIKRCKSMDYVTSLSQPSATKRCAASTRTGRFSAG